MRKANRQKRQSEFGRYLSEECSLLSLITSKTSKMSKTSFALCAITNSYAIIKNTGMPGFDRGTEKGEASRQADDVNQAKPITANDNELAYAA